MKRTLTEDAFVSIAEAKVLAVLARHHIGLRFTPFDDSRSSRSASFVLNKKPCTIEIYDGDISMTCGESGEQLFECYLTREWQSDVQLIEAFSRRLERYLEGGPWEEPDEAAPGPIARFVRKVLSHVWR